MISIRKKDNLICHSEAGEESSVFLFKSKNQERGFFCLKPQDDEELPNGVILTKARISYSCRISHLMYELINV